MSLQNLFVAKLPRNLTDADLLEIFAEFKPTSAKVMLDAATGKSKGFGFVLFATEEDGGGAYKALNKKSTRSCGHSFSLVIYPSNHDGRSAAESSNCLYIRNIPIAVPQERVEQFLRAFGEITFIAMREDHYGSPVWVVYAEYRTVDQAKNALNKLHGNNSYFHGSAPILAKFEDTESAKRERRRRREEAHAHGASVHAPPVMSGCVFPPPRIPGEGSSMDDIAGSHPGTAASATGVVNSGNSPAGPHARQAPFLAPASNPSSSLPLSYPQPPPSHEALSQYGFRPVPLSYNPMQANPFFPFGTPVDLYGAATAFSGPTPNMMHMPPPYAGGAMAGDRVRAPAAGPLLQPNTVNPSAGFLRDGSAPMMAEVLAPSSFPFHMPVGATPVPSMPMMGSAHGMQGSNSPSQTGSAHGSLLSPAVGAYVLQDGGQQFVLSSNVMNMTGPNTMTVSTSLPVEARMGGSSSPAAQASSYSATVHSAGNEGSHPIESLSGKEMDDFFNPYRSASQKHTSSPAPLLNGSQSDEARHSLFSAY